MYVITITIYEEKLSVVLLYGSLLALLLLHTFHLEVLLH